MAKHGFCSKTKLAKKKYSKLYVNVFELCSRECTDINECMYTNTNDCANNGLTDCVNTDGSYVCECKAAYKDITTSLGQRNLPWHANLRGIRKNISKLLFRS